MSGADARQAGSQRDAAAAPLRLGEFAAALLQPVLEVPAGVENRDRRRAERRFAVHRNNVVVGLVDALAESFPVTQVLVGPEFFRAMARERVLAEPPQSPVLTDYAIGFPDFIARFPPAAAVPYLAEVARIEALRIRTYHAADATPVADTAYRKLLETPERLAATRAVLHPACGWFRGRHAAYSIWRAHQRLQDMAEASLAGIDVARAEDVLITRPAFDVAATALPDGAVAWLDALRDGQSFAAAMHAAGTEVDGGALFALLMRYGLVTAFDPTPEH
ncbi:putative DNA-binding domain-containing protein [Luteimonas sp. R10]|uniref:HvfC/BufC family peptide modification chaperone n=1 Tax=Luteimonas sp. R10 TaxID=3108176 RepID=UPI003088A693|nr:DNA-binding domain-containing protein [Luteimonas sp. R10]